MSKLDFNQLVKLIHPDNNSDIQEPGEKLIEATRYMDDPSTLFKLAIRWGLKQGDGSKKDLDYVIDEGKDVNINGERHIIVEIQNSKNGIIVVTYNTNKKHYQKFEKLDKYDQDENFFVTGFTPAEEYGDIDFKYQAAKAGIKM